MTNTRAFMQLLLPSVVFFFGLPFLMERRLEPALVGAVICSVGFPWLVVTIIRVARSLQVDPPDVRRGFDVLPPMASPSENS